MSTRTIYSILILYEYVRVRVPYGLNFEKIREDELLVKTTPMLLSFLARSLLHTELQSFWHCFGINEVVTSSKLIRPSTKPGFSRFHCSERKLHRIKAQEHDPSCRGAVIDQLFGGNLFVSAVRLQKCACISPPPARPLPNMELLVGSNVRSKVERTLLCTSRAASRCTHFTSDRVSSADYAECSNCSSKDIAPGNVRQCACQRSCSLESSILRFGRASIKQRKVEGEQAPQTKRTWRALMFDQTF